MKNILVILTLILSSLPANAQPAGGKIFLGGNLGFSYTSQKTVYDGNSNVTLKRISYSVLPVAGYFLSDKIAVGAQLGISGSSEKPLSYENGQVNTTTMFYIGPLFRYYLISGTGGIFAEATINFGTGSDKRTYDNDILNTKDKLTSLSAGIAPGLYYYITPAISLEAKIGWLGYQTDIKKHEDDSKNTNSEFGFDLSPDLFFLGAIIML
jgi:outer membrane protein